MKEQSSCGLQIVATDINKKAVVICTEVLKIMAKPSDFRPEEQISFQITDIHVHAYILRVSRTSAVTSNGHMGSSCLVTGPFFRCHEPSHFPQCGYSFGPRPKSFHHLVRPILTSCVCPFSFWRLQPLFCILRHPRKSARHRITTQSTLVDCTINLHLDVSSP